jgi:uncharacterized cupredoxin-like copper-binding protein
MPQHSRTALAAVVALGATAIAGEAAVADSPSASASRTTTVKMTEFKFQPKTLTAKAGRFRVKAKNVGKVEHEFVLIRTQRAASKLPEKGNQASEKGAVGEIGEQKRGQSASKTFKLKKGRYVFICNVPGHYAGGMYGTLKVR